ALPSRVRSCCALRLVEAMQRDPVAAPDDDEVLGVDAVLHEAQEERRDAAPGPRLERPEDGLPGRRRSSARRLLLDDGERSLEVGDAAELSDLRPAVTLLG